MPFPFKEAVTMQAVFNEGSSMEISILTHSKLTRLANIGLNSTVALRTLFTGLVFLGDDGN